jgi:hypothetical protein
VFYQAERQTYLAQLSNYPLDLGQVQQDMDLVGSGGGGNEREEEEKKAKATTRDVR